MLAKLTSKNQITIPKAVLARLPRADYFDVDCRDGALILKPVNVVETNLEGVRAKIGELGLSEDCVREAVRWAREK